MTQVKVGRFICDSTADVHRRIHTRSKHPKVRFFRDDVIPGISPSRANSTGDLQGFYSASRKPSLQNLRSCAWDSVDRGEQLLEMEKDGQLIESGGKERTDDYNRTLLPHENDRMSHMFRAFQLSDGGKDESVDEDAADDDEEENAEAVDAALPWRSSEQMDALEDTSKYLIRDDDLLATPRVEDLDDDEGPRLDALHQSASLSSSSSFRNAPLPGGRGVARPDLSNCHGSVSLSHWLSEAESRHSEPFGPQHHHVLDAASMAEPSIRSSVDRRIGRQRATDCPTAAQRDHSSSEGASNPLAVAKDDDEWTMSRHEQVLHWLMSNDLAEKRDEKEEEEKEEDKEDKGYDLCSLDLSVRTSIYIDPNEIRSD